MTAGAACLVLLLVGHFDCAVDLPCMPNPSPQRPFFTLLTVNTFFLALVLCSIRGNTSFTVRRTSTSFFYSLIHSVRRRLYASYALSAMVGSSLLEARETLESGGRDGYSTVWRRPTLSLVTSGLHVVILRLWPPLCSHCLHFFFKVICIPAHSLMYLDT